MSAQLQSFAHGSQIPPRPRALVQELTLRPSLIGRIRLGIQVLTLASQENKRAVRIYDDGVDAGLSYKSIARQIETECGIKHSMKPENIEHLRISPSDFSDPQSVAQLLKMYGEDRGDGLKIYSLPILFPFDDPLKVMPHRFAAWTASSLQYFSEYSETGERYCMTYAKPAKSEVSSRLTRSFGGRPKEPRQDEFIDGHCDLQSCPQFQNGKCDLDLNLFFLIPGLKGAGVLQAHSTSAISMTQWYTTLSLVQNARGSLRNVEFRLTKKLMDTTYVNEKGVIEKSKNWVTILTAAVDIPRMMQEADVRAIENDTGVIVKANASADLLQNTRSSAVMLVDMSDDEKAHRHAQLQQYLATVRSSDKTDHEKVLLELKGYLKYLNVSAKAYEQYAIQKLGENWTHSIDVLQREVAFVSSRTEAEMQMILQQQIH